MLFRQLLSKDCPWHLVVLERLKSYLEINYISKQVSYLQRVQLKTDKCQFLFMCYLLHIWGMKISPRNLVCKHLNYIVNNLLKFIMVATYVLCLFGTKRYRDISSKLMKRMLWFNDQCGTTTACQLRGIKCDFNVSIIS